MRMPSLGSHEQHLPLTSDKLKHESTIVHTEEPISWAYLQRMGEGMLAGGWVTLKQSHWHVFTQHWALRASTYRTERALSNTTSQTNTLGHSENPAHKARSSKGRNDSGVAENSSEGLMTQHPMLPWGNIKIQQVQFEQTTESQCSSCDEDGDCFVKGQCATQQSEYCTVGIKYNGGQMVGASFLTNGAEGGYANH